MNEMYNKSFSLDEIEMVAKDVLNICNGFNKFYFYGEMGAGKTTFIKSLCKHLDVTDVISSPTFSIINEYKRQNGESVFHFDFYRIKNLTEVFDLGYEDYLYNTNYCFVEWPEKIEEIIPEENRINIHIKNINNIRNIVISK